MGKNRTSGEKDVGVEDRGHHSDQPGVAMVEFGPEIGIYSVIVAYFNQPGDGGLPSLRGDVAGNVRRNSKRENEKN